MAKRLLSYHALGNNTGTPRIWLENHRLGLLGFAPNTRFDIRPRAGTGVVIERSELGSNRISARKETPILDICAASKLASLVDYDHVKVVGFQGQIVISPSIQAFHIARSRKATDQIKVLELCAGGGTMHTAIAQDPRFKVVAAAEYDSTFANEYGRKAEDTLLIIGDIRKIHVNEYPDFDALVAGFPCVDFSNLGRAKKGLAGRPEAGDQADVFLPVMALTAARMPRAVVLENVPAIGTSHTAMLIRGFLRNLGYHLAEHILDANEDFGDIQARKRWCLVATLKPGFQIQPPGLRCTTQAKDLLDAPNAEQDKADVERIAKTMQCIERRITEHRQKGNGFGYSVINPEDTKIATLTKSMSKINQGPFVRTDFGLRMPRKGELERIAGHTVLNESFTTTCQIIGQGVSVKAFAEVFHQLGNFLFDQPPATTALPVGQFELNLQA